MVPFRHRAYLAAASIGVIFVAAGVIWCLRNLPAVVDPAVAATDPDFLAQGEYEYEYDSLNVAMQVAALGSGRFEGVLWQGGLPDKGWDGQKHRPRSRAKRDRNGIVTFLFPQQQAHLVGSEIVLVNAFPASDEEAPPDASAPRDPQSQWDRIVLTRVERESPTLGAAPPEGAVVLFDGTSDRATDEWWNPRLDEDLLREGAVSQRKFGDCRIHLEFRVPWMPKARGQARGNSGVFVASRYEVQILDSFGSAATDDTCGAIYRVAAPDVNASLPPLSWQTYDIDYTAPRFNAEGHKTADARMTVRHNGILVHNDVAISGPTGGATGDGEQFEDSLRLQRHGNPVRFRNVWVDEAGDG